MPDKSKKSGRTAHILGTAVIAVLLAASFFITYKNRQNLTADSDGSVSFSDTADASSDGRTEPERLHEVSRATVSATGDVIGHTAILNAAYLSKNKYNFDFIYRYLGSYVSSSDYAVTNLETTLGGGKYSGYPAFNSPDSLVDSIMGAGFDMLLTANNHANDTGYKGMHRTAQVLKKKKIDFIGTVENPEDKRYLVREVNGIRLGMVCYTYEGRGRSNGIRYLNGMMEKKSAAIINTFNVNNLDEFYTELGERMEAMKSEGAEAVIVYIHWGEEYHLEQNKHQKNIAQKLCDMGVDVIVGGHPHVVQPMELLTSTADSSHRTVCIYSIGNSISNQRRDLMKLKTGHTEDGVFISFTFVKYSDGKVLLSDVNVLPTWVYLHRNSKTGRNVFEIIPLDQSVKDWSKAYSLNEKGLKDAKSSYKRTMQLVGDGLEASRQYCRQQAEDYLNSGK